MSERKTYDLTLTIDVLDPPALIAQARQWLVAKGGRSIAEAQAECGDGDVEMALRILLDPGLDIDGIEIHDSTCTEV